MSKLDFNAPPPLPLIRKMAPGVVSNLSPAVPKDNLLALATVTANWDDTLRFYLNGTKVELESIDPEITLLEYLRGIGLTGTKLGCAEGGCGACTVVRWLIIIVLIITIIISLLSILRSLADFFQVVSQYNPTTKKTYHASVNACLAPLVSVDGKHVITVEGIGDSSNPHPVQERIAKMHGSQCGFCTPGIVMVRSGTIGGGRLHVPVSILAASWLTTGRAFMHSSEITLSPQNTRWRKPLTGIYADAPATDRFSMPPRRSASRPARPGGGRAAVVRRTAAAACRTMQTENPWLGAVRTSRTRLPLPGGSRCRRASSNITPKPNLSFHPPFGDTSLRRWLSETKGRHGYDP